MQKHGVFPKLYGIAGVLSYLIYCCFFTNHEHFQQASNTARELFGDVVLMDDDLGEIHLHAGDLHADVLALIFDVLHFSSFTHLYTKSVWQSATGFTQKRHTLYAYYSRGETEFQMVFCLPSPAASPALPICLRNYYNQKIHDNLNRNQASAFLHQWVGNMNPLPVETIE